LGNKILHYLFAIETVDGGVRNDHNPAGIEDSLEELTHPLSKTAADKDIITSFAEVNA
jgi:hypothetical protein